MIWCEHLKTNIRYNGMESIPGGYAEASAIKPMDEKWHFCPICGVKRPEERP